MGSYPFGPNNAYICEAIIYCITDHLIFHRLPVVVSEPVYPTESTLRVKIRSIRLPNAPASSTMDLQQLRHYDYSPLQDVEKDIRIVELLPGEFDDGVRVKLHHVSLLEPPDVADTRMTMSQLEATLPKGWFLARTLQGRYMFWSEEETTNHWQHPDSKIDKETYQLPTHHDILETQYEALSYVWGSDQKPHHLIVESGHDCTQLPVTDSLMAALRHLRRPNESRKLWVDAVCINQSDSVELQNQVQRMGLIYKLAYRVVVWLGLQGNRSAHAIATLRYLGAQVEVGEHEGILFPAPFTEEPTWYDSEVALPYNQDTWDAILALLQRPWFIRVWIVQEVQLGSRRPGPIFQCGTETIELSKFFRAVYCLYSKSILSAVIKSQRLAREITNVYMLLQPMGDYVFWDVLRYGTIGRRCKDGRDKIYGTIALLPKRFASRIKVDYGTSNTASQVYKKTFVTHAQHVERLELFADCFVAGRSIPDAPSWVPDWYSDGPGERYHTRQLATGASRAQFKYTDEEPDLLIVLGVSCAVVSHVDDYLPKLLEKQDAVDRVRQWQPRDLDTATYELTGEPLRKAYACTLIENTVALRWPDATFVTMEKWVDQAGNGFLFGDRTNSPGKLEIDDSMEMDAAINRALLYCGDRALMQTDECYIGLAPAETRPGDVVAIFLGCSNPMVLRPKEGRYSVIGESFVYGLDDAIRLLGPLPQPWRVITRTTSRASHLHYFFDPRTGETTREDPRLGPLYKWSRVDMEPEGDDPIHFDFFEHEDTGLVINYDPRLEPEMLEERGIQLMTFTLA